MKAKIFATTIFLLLISCSTQEDEPCENKHGYLRKDGKELACPFTLQGKISNKEWANLEGKVAVVDSTDDDFYPLMKWNSPYVYKIKMVGSKKDFTEEQYTVSLQAVDKNHKACGEAKEFIFHKIAETADSIEYNTVPAGSEKDLDREKYLFFAKREYPSYGRREATYIGLIGGSIFFYHVLKICDGDFYIKGEVIE